MDREPTLSLEPAHWSDADAASRWATTPGEVLQFAGPALAHPLSADALLATRDDGWTVLALREAGDPVGIGCFTTPGGGRAHLGRLLVDPRRRGRGLGRALVEALLAHVSALPGIALVSLNVYEHNVAAIALYEDLGFETVATTTPSTPDGRVGRRMQRPALTSTAG